MSHVVRRTATGLAVGAAVIALFLWCPLQALFPIMLVVSSLVQLEFYQLVAKYQPLKVFGIVLGALWLTATAAFCGEVGIGGTFAGLGVMMPLILAVLAFAVTFRSRFANPLGSIASTLFGFFYVPFMLSFFLRIVQLDGGFNSDFFAVPESRVGIFMLFALVAVTKFSDTGGFAFGLAFGRHRLCPSISPKKSWEGLLGSMVFSAAVAVLFKYLSVRFDWEDDMPVWGYLSYVGSGVVGAVIALAATAGDLVESRIKREIGVKDSATFMPAGMGGFLDMFDSLLFVPALVYPFILLAYA